MSLIQDHDDEIINVFSSIEAVRKVYMQPPSNEKLVYPCIIISPADTTTIYADDIPFIAVRSFDVLVIDYDMESSIPSDILKMAGNNFYIQPGRYYTADNLCHWSYTFIFRKSILV
jgi:hypothetical protein